MKLLFVVFFIYTVAFAQKQCSLLQQQGKWDESLRCSFEVLNEFKLKSGKQADEIKADACYNIGNIYFKVTDKTYSKLYFDSALYFATKTKYHLLKGKIYLIRNQLDSVRLINNKLNNADLWMSYHLKKCNFRDKNRFGNTHRNIDSAITFYNSSSDLKKFQYNIGFAQFLSHCKIHDTALIYLNKAKSFLKNIADMEADHHYALIACEIYLNCNNQDQAFYWYRQQDSLIKKFSSKPALIAMRELEDIRQFKIKDARLIEERNRFFIISIVSSSLLIILGILLYFIRKNRKQLIITTQLNQHLSFLLSTLSHDIRSPLVSLFYMNNKEHTEQTIRTTKQLKKIIAMVDDLLHWSSSNLNLITTHKVKIDLLEIIDEWNEFFKEDLKAKNLTLQLNAPKPLIYFDMQILQLILRNTLTNAIKYSKSDQEIEINLNYTDFNEGCLRILNTIDTEATHHTIPSKGLGLKLIIPLLKKEKIELTH